jgi:hypothetical protein
LKVGRKMIKMVIVLLINYLKNELVYILSRPVALWGLILFNNFITGTYLHNPMNKTDFVYALNQYVGKLNIVLKTWGGKYIYIGC